ncbi:hypothetical protein ACIP4S_12940 [Streptomyces chartreusis]|uniref:hypothetical protein n=1 Tax=Streptomyces chartreusis TaxID=1969 RepID=UPI00382BBCE8
MTNATAPDSAGYTMTMRVYTVTREGLITEDSGTRQIQPVEQLPDVQDGFPSCACPRCRARGAVVTL